MNFTVKLSDRNQLGFEKCLVRDLGEIGIGVGYARQPGLIPQEKVRILEGPQRALLV